MHIWEMAIGVIRFVNWWWVWMVCETQLGFFAGFFPFPLSACMCALGSTVSCYSSIPRVSFQAQLSVGLGKNKIDSLPNSPRACLCCGGGGSSVGALRSCRRISLPTNPSEKSKIGVPISEPAIVCSEISGGSFCRRYRK